MAGEYVVQQAEPGKGIGVIGQNLAFVGYQGAECVCSGPADTGKTFAMCLKVHLCACKYPDSAIAIIRKTQTSCYSTIVRTFTEQILGPDPAEWPCTPYGGYNKPERFNYNNGSVVFVRGLDKPSRILSAEFDLVAINQTEEISLAEWETLITRTTGRAGHMPYAQVIGDCNPAHPTHWLKQRAAAGSLQLIVTTHKDNPELWDGQKWTEQGEQRRSRLRRLTGTRYQRLYLGLWAAPEGAIYSMFDEERHKVKAFAVPQVWGRAVGIDPFGAEIAAVWVAFDPQAQVLNVYREYVEPFGLTTAEHAKKIRDKSAHEWISAWAGGGPSERAWRLEWEAAGIPLLEPPVGDVWVGIDRIIDLLNDFKLVIHDNCGNLLSEIGSYRRKLKSGVVTEQIEDKETYHCLDALRYVITFITQPGSGMEIVYQPVRIGAGL